MKRLLLVLTLVLMMPCLMHGQRFYARVGAGVSAATSKSLDLLYTYSYSSAGRMITVAPVGLGRGITGSAAVGYNANKFIGFEFGISQLFGFAKQADSIMQFANGASVDARVKGNMLSLIPSVVIHPGFDGIDPYARIGFVLGIRPGATATADAQSTTATTTDDYKAIRHFYGGASAGFDAALGAKWAINSWFSVYGEFNFTSISYSPRYSEVILYEKNGQDMLSNLTVRQTKTEYFTSINPDEPVDHNVPEKALRKSLPFSNAGLAFGMIFNF